MLKHLREASTLVFKIESSILTNEVVIIAIALALLSSLKTLAKVLTQINKKATYEQRKYFQNNL